MHLCQSLGEIQADSSSQIACCTAVLYLIVTLEDFLKLILRDTRTIILHLDLEPAAVCICLL